MAESVKLMKKWFDDIQGDEILGGLSAQEMAYIIYAAVRYGFSSEKTNFEQEFGSEFKMLALTMPNIYGQIDNIKNYDPSESKTTKYDQEKIYQWRMEGKTGKEICTLLGIGFDKERSLSSNPGWIRAKKELQAKKSTDSVQKNTDSVQTVTDFVQAVTECTDTDTTVQKLQKFNF